MEYYITSLSRLVLAGLIGFLIGKERKKNDKPGGSRTFGIMCLASCLLALLTLQLMHTEKPLNVTMDLSRIISYTIASIGFLCSGVIIQNKAGIEGLTTAGSLFLIVPIGICIGLGYYFLGITTSILMYIILEYKYWIGEKQ